MLNFTFHSQTPINVLALGAHCDDIEIGCGGTLLRLIQQKKIARLHWVVFSSNPSRKIEAQNAARFFLQNLPEHAVQIHEFADGYFPSNIASIKQTFEQIKKQFSPDLIFTHHKDDLHQDHRVLADLTWNTFRNHAIFEYEIPKYDGNPFNPGVYVQLDKSIVDRKIDGLMTHFPSQSTKSWFTPDTFAATLRIRGVESASPFAESFICRKMLL